MDITKTCKLCNILKPINEYYKNKQTGYYHSNCLKCVNEQRKKYKTNGNYIPKPIGLMKYTEDIQTYVRDSIKNNVDIKEISEHSNIPKSTLLLWIKNGRIDKT
jgi:NADPH-dependent glutamate synthase beta subunit-like oxidoreductase